MDERVAGVRFSKSISLVTIVLLLSWHDLARATSHHYYPLSFKETSEELSDDSLKRAIRKVLISDHWYREGMHDVLKRSCKKKTEGYCYRQKILSYRQARKILFRKLHLDRDEQGEYVTDVYCGRDVSVKRNKTFYRTINCEHTWPQSKFNRRESRIAQKSDLHHLFPVDSVANSIRSNKDFGEGGDELSHCNLSRRNGNTFEPPDEHKGNVARALFYFSIRYKTAINNKQERVLKIWHEEDPVDEQERERNHKIYQVQRVRNPFIDFPEMVGRISNF